LTLGLGFAPESRESSVAAFSNRNASEKVPKWAAGSSEELKERHSKGKKEIPKTVGICVFPEPPETVGISNR
jgi:hypothetical protein